MKTTTDNMLKFANEFIERNDITDYELSIQHNSLYITGKINDLDISIIIGSGDIAASKRKTSIDECIADLYYNKKLTQIEIARALGVSQGSVSRRLKFYNYKKEIENLQNDG